MNTRSENDAEEKAVAEALSYCVEHCLDLDEEDDDDEDPVMTVEEIIEEEKRMQETARIVLGGQDEKVCTYPEGYKPRQALYSCLTCVPASSGQHAGICYGCSIHCHDGHELVEMYTKRLFRCDCGNSKFSTKCTLYEEKDSLNERNSYNANFENHFCLCRRPYPDPTYSETMVQCTMCEDWFHPTHIQMTKEDMNAIENKELVCASCTMKFSFLSKLTNEKTCLKDVIANLKEEDPEHKYILLSSDWREKLCHCPFCLDTYDTLGCSFITSQEDSIETYTKESEEKTKGEQAEEEVDVNSIAKEFGREGAIRFIRGMHEVTETIKQFFASQDPAKVVTAESVKTFFDQAKRRRFNEEEPQDGW